MGINGKDFTEKHKDAVIQMQRSILDFVKSAQLRSREEDPLAADDSESGDTSQEELKMTEDGCPILPKIVVEKALSK